MPGLGREMYEALQCGCKMSCGDDDDGDVSDV